MVFIRIGRKGNFLHINILLLFQDFSEKYSTQSANVLIRQKIKTF